MRQYLELLDLVLKEGKYKEDRTGTGTYSVFGAQKRYDLQDGFPLITTKKMPFNQIVHEVLWFLQGKVDIQYLHDNKVHFWDPWINEEGNLGRIYPAQWRDWRAPDGRSVDQIAQVIEDIKNNPDSRRLIVSAWNPGELDQMSIPNCCSLFQFYVQGGELSCHLYQRSGDLFLGVPFNIVQYSLLTNMIAQVTDLKPKELIHTFGDLHLYSNHVEQAKTQLAREPRPLPTLKLNPAVKDINSFKAEDFSLSGYNPLPHIEAPISV